MKQYFCMNCMRPYPEGEAACPGCGNVHGQEVQNPQALPCGTILNGRYLVGKAQKQDPVCIIYVGMDLTVPAPVVIREFLPDGQATRTDGTIQWSIPPKAAKALCQSFHASAAAGVSDAFVANKTVYLITPAETAPAEVLQEPAADKPAAPRKGRKIAIMAVSAAAAAAVLIGGWCGIQHAAGSRHMQKEEYAAAAKSYRMDFLFGRSARRDALRAAADAAFEAGDFSAAADYFRQLGSDAETLWEDAIVEQLAAAVADGRVGDIPALLEQVSDSARADVLMDRARLLAAERLLESGKLSEAIAAAEAIQNASNADASALLAKAYAAQAEQFLEKGSYNEAMAAYQKLPDNAAAQANLEILTALESGNYLEAAKLTQTAVEQKTTDVTMERWAAIFDSYMGSIPGNDLSAAVSHTYVKSLLRTEDPFTAENFKTLFEVGPMIDQKSFDPDLDITFTNRTALLQQCKGTGGKILVVVETRDYPNRTPILIPSMKATSLLPAQYIPQSLEEVSHIILVSYSYSDVGAYNRGTSAYREDGVVFRLLTPSGAAAYTSPIQTGENPPAHSSFSGTPPKWLSGGAPNMGQTVYETISKLIAG